MEQSATPERATGYEVGAVCDINAALRAVMLLGEKTGYVECEPSEGRSDAFAFENATRAVAAF